MKKLTTTIMLILSLGICHLHGQYFNEEVVFTPDDYRGEAYMNKGSCELPNGNIVAVGKVLEPGSSGPISVHDGILTVHDPSGAILGSYRYDSPDRNEEFVGVIPADQSPFGTNEVIVVGKIDQGSGGYDMLVTRIDAATGIPVFSHSYGGHGRIDHAEAVISVDGSSDEYIVIGATQDPAVFPSPQKAFAFRIDASGGVLWSQRYTDTYAGTSNHEIIPKNIRYRSASKTFVIAGNYTYPTNGTPAGGINRDLFTMVIDEYGYVTGDIMTYGIRQTFDEFGVDLALMQNGDMALTFSTGEVPPVGDVPGGFSPNVFSAVALLYLDKNRSPISRSVDLYWNPNRTENMPIGIYENEQGTGFDIGTRTVELPATSPSLNHIGFMHVPHSVLIGPGYHEFNLASDQEGGSMVRANAGYLLKGFSIIASPIPNTPPSFGYTLIGVNNLGQDVGNSCLTDQPVMDRKAPVVNQEILTYQTKYGELWTADLPSELWLSGDMTYCSGQQIAFKKASVSSSDNKVYPALIPRGCQAITLELEAKGRATMTATVHSSVGQKVYSQELTCQEGGNTFYIPAQQLVSGMNILIVYDKEGAVVLSEKLLKE